MTEDETTLFGSIRRFARTSTAVGGIAARVAGERYLGIKTDRASHAEDLKVILGGLKGPLMKVAQFLSSIPDALPPEYAAELAQLQSNAPAMGWPFVRRRMAGELGPAWQSKFADFGQEAAAAASLGQVHKATLPDGRVVACKLQYPDMPNTVEADLRQMKMAMSVYKRIDNAIQQEDIYEELVERLREELDYAREAAHVRLYRQMLAHIPDVHVPEPIEGYCTGRLLTMTWLEGQPLMKWLASDPPQEARNRVATALFRAWYVPFYRYGVLHGDPHLGNYQVRPDGGLNLLDFGTVRIFPAHTMRGVLTLYEAMRDKDVPKARQAHEIVGFKGLSDEAVDVLNLWARFLYEPFLDDRVRPLQENDDPEYRLELANTVHEGLRRVGGVRPPREFVLLDRSALGLGAAFMHLRAELNWHHLFEEAAADFDETAFDARQKAALAAAGVPGAS